MKQKSRDELARESAAGERARRLLDEPLLQEAVNQAKERALAAFYRSEPGDIEAREAAYVEQRALGKILAHLETVADTGKLAEAELKQLADAEEAAKRRGENL